MLFLVNPGLTFRYKNELLLREFDSPTLEPGGLYLEGVRYLSRGDWVPIPPFLVSLEIGSIQDSVHCSKLIIRELLCLELLYGYLRLPLQDEVS
ncbi:hypothetical protein KAT59_00875 [Candidatus Bipolaricaulota bacterium]|nr:hypothetical protein [Candidatus Bipolaricaulota bacterium]